MISYSKSLFNHVQGGELTLVTGTPDELLMITQSRNLLVHSKESQCPDLSLIDVYMAEPMSNSKNYYVPSQCYSPLKKGGSFIQCKLMAGLSIKDQQRPELNMISRCARAITGRNISERFTTKQTHCNLGMEIRLHVNTQNIKTKESFLSL